MLLHVNNLHEKRIKESQNGRNFAARAICHLHSCYKKIALVFSQSAALNFFSILLILIQWTALKARSDWLLKLRISFDIHLQATRAGFAPENIVIVAGIN